MLIDGFEFSCQRLLDDDFQLNGSQPTLADSIGRGLDFILLSLDSADFIGMKIIILTINVSVNYSQHYRSSIFYMYAYI